MSATVEIDLQVQNLITFTHLGDVLTKILTRLGQHESDLKSFSGLGDLSSEFRKELEKLQTEFRETTAAQQKEITELRDSHKALENTTDARIKNTNSEVAASDRRIDILEAQLAKLGAIDLKPLHERINAVDKRLDSTDQADLGLVIAQARKLAADTSALETDLDDDSPRKRYEALELLVACNANETLATQVALHLTAESKELNEAKAYTNETGSKLRAILRRLLQREPAASVSILDAPTEGSSNSNSHVLEARISQLESDMDSTNKELVDHAQKLEELLNRPLNGTTSTVADYEDLTPSIQRLEKELLGIGSGLEQSINKLGKRVTVLEQMPHLFNETSLDESTTSSGNPGQTPEKSSAGGASSNAIASAVAQLSMLVSGLRSDVDDLLELQERVAKNTGDIGVHSEEIALLQQRQEELSLAMKSLTDMQSQFDVAGHLASDAFRMAVSDIVGLSGVEKELARLRDILAQQASLIGMLRSRTTSEQTGNPGVPTSSSDIDNLRDEMNILLASKAETAIVNDGLDRKADKKALSSLQEMIEKLRREVDASGSREEEYQKLKRELVLKPIPPPTDATPARSHQKSDKLGDLTNRLKDTESTVSILARTVNSMSSAQSMNRPATVDYVGTLIGKLDERIKSESARAVDKATVMSALGALDGAIRSKADRAELQRLEKELHTPHDNGDGAAVKVSCLSCDRDLHNPAGMPEHSMLTNALPPPPHLNPSFFTSMAPRRSLQQRRFMFTQRSHVPSHSELLCMRCLTRPGRPSLLPAITHHGGSPPSYGTNPFHQSQ